MSDNKLLVGCDPEFFLRDKETRQFVSAHNLVPGNKTNPHKVKQGAVQADGTAVEFNINPASTAEEFASNVEAVLKELRLMIDKKYEFVFNPSVIYEAEYFNSLPESAKELGCDPDYTAYNIYGFKENPRPNGSTTVRTGSGHIHIGWTSGRDTKGDRSHQLDCAAVVSFIDSLFDFHQKSWDTDNLRRTMYGKPKAFRFKPYGVEYRSLSNAWLNNPELWPWIFEMVKYSINTMKSGQTSPPYLFDYYYNLPGLGYYFNNFSSRELIHKAVQKAKLRYKELPSFPLPPAEKTVPSYMLAPANGSNFMGARLG